MRTVVTQEKARMVETPFSAAPLQMLNIIRKRNYYPHIETINELSGLGEVVVIDGVPMDNFASNSYLGLSRHPRVVEAAKAAAERFGIGSGGSRLTSGSQTPHRQLEERIAEYKSKEAAIVFSSGYLANVGVLPAILNSHLTRLAAELDPEAEKLDCVTNVFFDELVHASIIDGIQLAQSKLWGGRVRSHLFLHRDVEELEQRLATTKAERALVVTDGVFSLHGRVAPLDQIVGVAHRYNAAVYVDDAHGTGVLGPHGRGTADLYGVEDEIDFPIGTMSKALGGEGGFFVGSHEMCQYLRVGCRTQMFQTSMSPPVAAGLLAAIDIIDHEPEHRERLLASASRVNTELVRLGFNTFGSRTQIIPVCFGSDQQAKLACEILGRHRIFAPPYYYPAVRKGEAMVRINLMSSHTNNQLEHLLTAFEEAGQQTGVL